MRYDNHMIAKYAISCLDIKNEMAVSLILILLVLQPLLSSSEWLLDIQLHNYSNPHKALYNATTQTSCCYTDPSNCNRNVSKLACTTVFVFCTSLHSPDEQCITSKPIYGTPNISFSDTEAGNNLFTVLTLNGTTYPPDSSLTFRIIVHNNINLQFFRYKTQQLIDNITIQLPFIENETFSDASTYTGTYNIARFTLAYRIRCAENYYGDKCDIYCVDTDSNCGHYKCNCERKKECDDGYMNNKINCTEIALHTTSQTQATCVSKSFLTSCASTTVYQTSTVTATTTSVTTVTSYVTDLITSTAKNPTLTPTSTSRSNASTSKGCDCSSWEAGVGVILVLLIGIIAVIAAIMFFRWYKTHNIFSPYKSITPGLVNPNYNNLTIGTGPTNERESFDNSSTIYDTVGQNYESHYELHVSNETQQEHPHHTESSNSSKYELISSVIKDEEMYESL